MILPKRSARMDERILFGNRDPRDGLVGKLFLVPFDARVLDRLRFDVFEKLRLEIVGCLVRGVVLCQEGAEDRSAIVVGRYGSFGSFRLGGRGGHEGEFGDVIAETERCLAVLPLRDEVDVGNTIARILHFVIVPLA